MPDEALAVHQSDVSGVRLLEVFGELDVQPFLSHELTLDEVNRGFELMEAQDGIRSVIRFGP